MAKNTERNKRAIAIESRKRYNKKAYNLIGVHLRKGEDDDVYNSYLNAKKKGYTAREWARLLFDGYGNELR